MTPADYQVLAWCAELGTLNNQINNIRNLGFFACWCWQEYWVSWWELNRTCCHWFFIDKSKSFSNEKIYKAQGEKRKCLPFWKFCGILENIIVYIRITRCIYVTINIEFNTHLTLLPKLNFASFSIYAYNLPNGQNSTIHTGWRTHFYLWITYIPLHL